MREKTTVPKGQSVQADRALYIFLAALLSLLLFAQAMTSIPRLSVTFDEDLHISTGYSVLRTGDLRLVEDHPPALGLWMSWPLLLSSRVPDPAAVPAWEQGDRRLFVRNEMWWSLPIDTWVIPPRIPVVWLAVLLAAFLFRWATEWFGPRAGLVALAFLAFDPNILAHATLATLDLGVACLIFITMYALQRFFSRPTWPRLIGTAVSLGLALGSKISALILLPVSVGLMALWGLRLRRKDLAVWISAYLGVALLTLWAVHLFGVGRPAGLPFSLPAPSYWRSFLEVGRHVARGNRAYLLGESYRGGRWYYFPVALALKTPLPALLLAGGGVLSARPGSHRRWRRLLLASLPASYFVASMLNEINLGYRHLLPIVPFLYLSVAGLVAWLEAGRIPRFLFRPSRFGSFVLRAGVLALCLWQVVGTLQVWPFHLTFFNEIAGGPRNGYRYLADSNVDWGQGLKALRSYLEERSWPDVRLSSFTFFVRPELYGIRAAPLPPLADAPALLPARFNPAPGTYVISASTLRGLQCVDSEMYNWFWHREPDDVIANAMLVYQVSEGVPRPTWLAQCDTPVVPLSVEAVAEGFGRTDLRLLTFDCTQSWLYPSAGESAGWYMLHREVLVPEEEFTAQRLALSRLSFEQEIPGTTPPLTVFEWNPRAISVDREDAVWAAPAEWPPAQAIADGAPLSAPVQLDGPLTFLGYEVNEGEHAVTLISYWRVEERPGRPFSLMAHLLGTEASPVTVSDGVGIAWDQLEAGDLLVQRHVLSAPPELPPGLYWLQTGAYWLDPVERWGILDGRETVGDRILLETVALP